MQRRLIKEGMLFHERHADVWRRSGEPLSPTPIPPRTSLRLSAGVSDMCAISASKPRCRALPTISRVKLTALSFGGPQALAIDPMMNRRIIEAVAGVSSPRMPWALSGRCERAAGSAAKT